MKLEKLVKILTKTDVPSNIKIGGKPATFRWGINDPNPINGRKHVEIVYEVKRNGLASGIERIGIGLAESIAEMFGFDLPVQPDSVLLYRILPNNLGQIKENTDIPLSNNIVYHDRRYLVFGSRAKYLAFIDGLKNYISRGNLGKEEFLRIVEKIGELSGRFENSVEYPTKLHISRIRNLRATFEDYFIRGSYIDEFKGPKLFGTSAWQPF